MKNQFVDIPDLGICFVTKCYLGSSDPRHGNIEYIPTIWDDRNQRWKKEKGVKTKSHYFKEDNQLENSHVILIK